MTLRRQFRFIWRYFTGDLPWDSGVVPPEITGWLDAHDGAPGRALDLGSGPGTTAIHLAQQGWDVTGVDFAPNAVRLARRRARREARSRAFSGSLTFLSADVSRPTLLAQSPPFDLLIDVGCLHGLPLGRRPGYAANVIRLAQPGATMLLYAFLPHVRDSGRRAGIDREGLRHLLGDAYEIVDYTEGEEVTTPRPSAWYTLRRTARV